MASVSQQDKQHRPHGNEIRILLKHGLSDLPDLRFIHPHPGFIFTVDVRDGHRIHGAEHIMVDPAFIDSIIKHPAVRIINGKRTGIGHGLRCLVPGITERNTVHVRCSLCFINCSDVPVLAEILRQPGQVFLGGVVRIAFIRLPPTGAVIRKKTVDQLFQTHLLPLNCSNHINRSHVLCSRRCRDVRVSGHGRLDGRYCHRLNSFSFRQFTDLFFRTHIRVLLFWPGSPAYIFRRALILSSVS